MHSRAELFDHFRELAKPVSITRSNSSVRLLGDVALVWGDLSNEILQRKTGQLMRFKVRVLQVWRLRDNAWRNVAVHCTRLES